MGDEDACNDAIETTPRAELGEAVGTAWKA